MDDKMERRAELSALPTEGLLCQSEFKGAKRHLSHSRSSGPIVLKIYAGSPLGSPYDAWGNVHLIAMRCVGACMKCPPV